MNIDLQHLLHDLTSGDEERAERAVTSLIEMGEDVIPALLDLTKSPEVDYAGGHYAHSRNRLSVGPNG